MYHSINFKNYNVFNKNAMASRESPVSQGRVFTQSLPPCQHGPGACIDRPCS